MCVCLCLFCSDALETIFSRGDKPSRTAAHRAPTMHKLQDMRPRQSRHGKGELRLDTWQDREKLGAEPRQSRRMAALALDAGVRAASAVTTMQAPSMRNVRSWRDKVQVGLIYYSQCTNLCQGRLQKLRTLTTALHLSLEGGAHPSESRSPR